MKIVDRSLHPISVSPTDDRRGLEVRVHGATPQGDFVTLMTPQDARVLAFGLLAEAEKLGAR
ncbi:MAG: hypothetical protein HY727_14690 [Candidatus Rokubacteria bacterium]|nr:hypothetical protein [Candidatus Rokubacteria bacterium]